MTLEEAVTILDGTVATAPDNYSNTLRLGQYTAAKVIEAIKVVLRAQRVLADLVIDLAERT